jgi:hypothetical protein
MTISIRWPSGTVRRFTNLDDNEVSRLIAHVEALQEKEPIGPITITLTR